MSGFSLKFTKTAEKKVLIDSKIRDDSTKDNDLGKDFIKDVKDNEIIGSIKKEVKGPLVIPLITKNKWRTTNGDNSEEGVKSAPQEVTEEDKEEMTLLEEAAKEILEETEKELRSWENRGEGGKRTETDVPAILSNSIPKGFEEDDGVLDVGLRAEASTLEDYENVPIDQYGMAMLRGMGWKPGEGIGGYKKEVVQIIDPLSRPKGLGLGATRPNTENKSGSTGGKGEEALVLKKGAFVLVQGGAKRGLYGEVEGLDEDNGRVILRMGVGGEVASVSENVIKLVTKQEFKERGKVVNLDKYEKYKKEESKKKEVEEEDRRKRKEEKRRYKDSEKHSRKNRSRSRDNGSPDVKRVKKARTWVMPQLRVRCIDSKVKSGKYYNVKMVVIDVVSPEICDCRTEEGKLVEGIRTDKLETVIPKGSVDLVMLVRGDRRGEVGQVVDRDKAKYMATVQLVGSDELLVVDYDSVCQYLGEVADMD